jgi:hypothetical protein
LELVDLVRKKVLIALGLSQDLIGWAIFAVLFNIVVLLVFILIGVQTFSDGSTFTATISGILPFFAAVMSKAQSGVENVLRTSDALVDGVMEQIQSQ